jgi:hypothetical protein
MNKDTGGTAFPRSDSLQYSEYITGGMTLRDYFAAKAMQGLIGCSDWRESMDEHNASDFTAFSAYAMADAMLKAREQ